MTHAGRCRRLLGRFGRRGVLQTPASRRNRLSGAATTWLGWQPCAPYLQNHSATLHDKTPAERARPSANGDPDIGHGDPQQQGSLRPDDAVDQGDHPVDECPAVRHLDVRCQMV